VAPNSESRLTSSGSTRLEKSFAEWEYRLGPDAAREWKRRFYCRLFGRVSAPLLLVVFMIASSAHNSTVAAIALILAFAGSVPCLFMAAVFASRTGKQVSLHYGLVEHSGRTLSMRILNNPELFADWLAKQKRAEPPPS
jgi:hypothetical protein